MRIAVILGKLGSAVHGKLDVNGIFDSTENFVTGTVSGFFNIAWGLAESGNEVDAFCDTPTSVPHSVHGGANFYPLHSRVDLTYDAYISINEPDILRAVPGNKPRLCATWLNNFSFCKAGFDAFVDRYVCPSETLALKLNRIEDRSIDQRKMAIIPLGINLEFFAKKRKKRPGSIAYCSSPDRGLHHLLALFPQIRATVPEAHLRIYYRYWPWYEDVMTNRRLQKSPIRIRAEIIAHYLKKLGTDGQNGVHLIGPIPPRRMAEELLETKVLAYTCDPITFTEGFSAATMEACAAGAVPIISDADALPEIYWNAAHVMRGNPRKKSEDWISAIVMALTNESFSEPIRSSAMNHAREHARQQIARRWEILIRETIERRHLCRQG